MRTTRRTRPSPRRDAAEPFTGALVYLAAPEVRELAATRQRMEALERRFRVFAAANELLEAPPETLAERASDVLSRLGCLLVPALADFVRIDLLREDGTVEASATVDGGPEGWHPDGAPEPSARATLPLRARGRALGVLTLAAAAPRALDRDDVRLAEEVARGTAVALDNARLLVQARAEAHRREQALAAVSHEMRGPLQVISIASGALLRAWPAEDALLPHRRQVAVIADAAERTRRLAADLLDLSRVDAGHFSVAPEPVRLGVLLNSVVELHRPLAEERGIRLAAGPVPACTALADEERMHQVFANLIANAVRFTPAGGTITVSAEDAGGEIRCTVSDTGTGIEPGHLPRVFDRFWTAGKCRGCAGLGLAISRAIVEAHGGAIRAESRPGEGATITFTLPRAEA